MSEDPFRRFFDSPLMGMAITSSEGRWLQVNHRICACFGYSRDELLEKTWLELTPPEDRAAEAERYHHALVAGLAQEQIQEKRFVRKDGSIFYAQHFTMGLLGEDGSLESLLSVVQDITHQKRVEEALQQSQRMEGLGLLAGGIAHDFGNLLASAFGHLERAQLEIPTDSSERPHLQRLGQTLDRASDLVRHLLAYAGKGTTTREPVELNDTVKELLNLLSVSFSAQVHLRFEPSFALALIEADRGQLQQVVMNLVGNAAEAIGDRAGEIILRTFVMDLDEAEMHLCFPTQGLSPGRHVILEVSDTGCGMTPEVKSRIFDPFFTTKKNGRGLGLATTLGILQAHGATLRVHSREGHGTTFHLVFPALAEA